jgi:hypothetical protein
VCRRPPENHLLPRDCRCACRDGLYSIYIPETGTFEDANESISWDSTWLKSYTRRASALYSLGDLRGVLYSWIDAGKHCDESSWAFIAAQLKTAQTQWVKVFLSTVSPIDSVEDLCDRFALLPTKRERERETFPYSTFLE